MRVTEIGVADGKVVQLVEDLDMISDEIHDPSRRLPASHPSPSSRRSRTSNNTHLLGSTHSTSHERRAGPRSRASREAVADGSMGSEREGEGRAEEKEGQKERMPEGSARGAT
jgi:hypothetical protein